jgi:hypothetical protein
MSIVFGWNSFKVRSFTLAEIGIMKQPEPGLQLEVRQAYFHLFWIPMFGLGKRWVVRKGGKMYDMPDEIIALARKSLTGLRMPWYTCAGPIMLLSAAIIFSAVSSYQDAQSHKRSVNDFRERADALTTRLQHLTTNDFITIVEKNAYGHQSFLKVEDIKGDDIMVTQVEGREDEPMELEYEYTKHASTLPSVKVSLKQLLKAFPKDLDSMMGDAADRQAANLLNDSILYTVKDVVRHFRPMVKVSFANFYKDEITIGCHNEGWPATITGIKNEVGDIDWSGTINKEFPSDHRDRGSHTLGGKNAKYREPYKFVMTLKDTTGHFYKYEFEGVGNKITLHEL